MAPKSITTLTLFFLPMFLALFAFGQSDMSSTSTGVWNKPTSFSNFPPCSTGGITCWHSMPGNATYLSTRGFATIMVDSSNNGWLYTEFPTNAWTKQTAWGSVYEVQLGGDLNYYGLIPHSGCASELGEFVKWSGTAWNPVSQVACSEFHSLSVSPNGTGFFVAIRWDNTPMYSTDYGAHWTFTSGTTVLSVSSLGYNFGTGLNEYVAVKSDHTVWTVVGSGTSWTWTQIGGMTNAVSVDIEKFGTIYAVGSDGYTYHYSGSGSAWDKLNGSGNTSVANGGSFNVWTIGTLSGGNNLYRISDTGLQFSRTYDGSVSCNIPPPYGQTICATFTHQAHLQISVAGVTGPEASATQWSGAGQWGLTATVNLNDPYSCLIGAGCTPQEPVGQMACTGGGSNNDNYADWNFPCFNPNFEIPDSIGPWPVSSVYIFLDPATVGSEGTDICNGINSWSGVDGVTFLSCSYQSLATTQANYGTRSWIWVTENPAWVYPGPEGGPAAVVATDTSLPHSIRHAMITFGPFGAYNGFVGPAAHEEGHLDGLWDCYWCASAVGQNTVMGSQPTFSAAQPTTPQLCDIFWWQLYFGL